MALDLYHNLVLGGQDAHLGGLCPPMYPSRIGLASIDHLQAYTKMCLR